MARDNGLFSHDLTFNEFPQSCCGDTSTLLAEYLQKKQDIKTIWYSAQRGDSTHAWLIVNDERIMPPKANTFCWPDELKEIVSNYSGGNNEKVVAKKYNEEDLCEGLILDITSDQFPDYTIPAYVGYFDKFHLSFDFIEAHEHDGLTTERLRWLFKIINMYLD